MKPVLELDTRLGEGTRAAIQMSIAETIVRLFKEMATFEEAGRIISIVQLPVCTMPEYLILPVLSFNFKAVKKDLTLFLK
jgi:hypothetical protein